VGEITRGIRIPDGEAQITFEIYEEDGRICCGILTLKGHLTQPPKAWIRTMRKYLTKIEDMARESGCHELRIAGRDWAKIFPSYEPYDGPRNGIRKVF
jgi:hypothetical protein